MFVSSKLVGLFEIARETVDALRLDIAALRAENSAVKGELASLKVTNDWMRHKINGLEVERAALFNRAYNVSIPAPEIIGAPRDTTQQTLAGINFEHVDDVVAKKLGIENLLS
jgi:hypothetical protein